MVGTGLKMLETQDKMLGKQDETLGEIRNTRNDLKSYFDSRITKLEKDIFQIKKKINIPQ